MRNGRPAIGGAQYARWVIEARTEKSADATGGLAASTRIHARAFVDEAVRNAVAQKAADDLPRRALSPEIGSLR